MDEFFQKERKGILLFFLVCFSFYVSAQTTVKDTLLQEVTLKTAIDYAIKFQPAIQQSLIDEQITASNIKSKLADWYPQVNFNYNFQHNFILPSNIIGGNLVRFGAENTSVAQFALSQTLFNKDVLLAKRTKGDVQLQSTQATENNKIDLVANVSKAFYDVLATGQQIKVAAENIVRIERSLQDATNQYKAGITDKIDYKRATISLNNIKASKKSNEELYKAKIEYLKSLMGYPETESLNIVYDSLAMEREIVIDTLQRPDYRNRIEYKLLETQRKLLQSNLLYNKWSYLPSLSLNGAYNLNFQNNLLNKLYANNYPNSFAAVTLGVPIFQGGKRNANIKTAELQLQRSDQDITRIRNTVNTQYAQALASYKAILENYLALKENVALAKEVYDVIQLQYRSGIKTYLEVITAETDLRTSQINYFNALYQVLSSKVDLQRALGQITY
jgi:outer membrane protein